MKREIKFRGQTISGDWVSGNLSHITKKLNNVEAGYYISNSVGMPFAYQVRPETVGQFTGLYDKNKVEIYETDVAKRITSNCYSEETLGVIKYINGCFVFCYKTKIGECKSHMVKNNSFQDGNAYVTLNYSYEVIGNIYDNKELIE